jgi:hypothetical protein
MKFIVGDFKYFKKHVTKKNPSKNPFYEKVKMFKKGPFVVGSFVTIGSFDYDCTQYLFFSGNNIIVDLLNVGT